MAAPAPEESSVTTGRKSVQIYAQAPSSSSSRLVTPFWKDKYDKDAKRYWNKFYKRHQDKFFKDRHYLDKEWGRHFEGSHEDKLVVLEVGCGVGNTIFPLLSTYPNIVIHACDFSDSAIDLVKRHKDFLPDRINAFVCDLTVEDLCETIKPSSVDIVTMIFVLSAVSPEKMPLVLRNIRNVLKHGGIVLFRDYAFGDLAQKRFILKGQQLSENFYVRGDGTRAFYFCDDYLLNLFTECGFTVEEIGFHDKEVENRSLELVMKRHWIQAVFSVKSTDPSKSLVEDFEKTGKTMCAAKSLKDFNNKMNTEEVEVTEDRSCNESLKENSDIQMDLSEDIRNIFNMSCTLHETIQIKMSAFNFQIKAVGKEHQHTCKSTGLMLWESAYFFCHVLEENPSIVRGKIMLELGCGSAGLCSLVAAHFAEVIVATDGDEETLNLLRQNVSLNLANDISAKLVIRTLLWGDQEDINAVKELPLCREGFDIILGTDVTYNAEDISSLFATAKGLISIKDKPHSKPSLILCHIQRRVDENTIVSTANMHGFRLIDKWNHLNHESDGVISSWLSNGDCLRACSGVPVTILYFQL